jgi:hypothetical protein
MGDHLIYEDAISSELYTTSEFVDKKWMYVNDNNQGNYASQVQIDTTSLSNSGKWMGWSEAVIIMPLVIQFETPAAPLPVYTGGGANIRVINTIMNADDCYDWVVGLKNGYWQMIHSLTVEFNNRNVVQQVPFLNVYSSFRNLTTWSKSDLKCWGALCGFYPDTPSSWIYNTYSAAGVGTANLLGSSGIGLANNRNCPYVSITNFMSAFANANTAYNTFAGAGDAGMIPSSYNFTTKCTVPNNSVRQLFNEGFQKRQSWINYNSTVNNPANQLFGDLQPDLVYQQATDNGAPNTIAGFVGAFTIQNALANQGVLISSTVFTQTFQANISTPDGGGNSRIIQVPAVIRLKDICNFFEKVPLLKGSTMRLYINTNQCFFTAQYINGQLVSVAPVAGTVGQTTELQYSAVGLITPPQILGGGGTNPLMLASNDIGQGGYNLTPYTLADSAGTGGGTANNANNLPPNYMQVKFAVSIGRCQFQSQFTTSATATSVFQQCRLYCPAYTLSPIAEQQLLSLAPTKEILYDDIFQYSFSNVSATFNLLVSNGVPNIKSVIVMGFLNATANGNASTQYNAVCSSANTVAPIGQPMLSTSTLLSPFSTSGATPDPITLQNFQILISGNTLFQQPMQYGYEEFLEQVVSINQLNGSLTTGLASGLIGYDEWQHGYRYYVGDASRILPSEEGMARSVQIQGTIPNGYPAVDLQVFIVYEKKIVINVSTGQEIV